MKFTKVETQTGICRRRNKNYYTTRTFICISLILLSTNLWSQKGVVSYISARNTYVKFRSTAQIAIGDTLYRPDGSPCLRVENKSSISCISVPVSGCVAVVGDSLIVRVKKSEELKLPIQTQPPVEVVRPPDTELDSIVTNSKSNTSVASPVRAQPRYVRPRVSVASYNNFADIQPTSTWRLTWQANGALKQNSKISLDQYVVYRRSYDAQDTFLNRFGNAFKVYALAAQMQLGKAGQIAIGRKINQRFSSVGALDGLQYERQLNRHISAGALLGSRPRLSDYSIDFNLIQGGFWVGLSNQTATNTPTKYWWQTTFGLMEQRNGSATDRRFFYGQHQHTVGSFSIFGSTEIDFYQNIHDTVSLSPALTNLYVQTRYRIGKKSDISLAYDNRRNIIYYESYKLFIDQLVDNETRQGLRLHYNYRPLKRWSIGVNGNMRFQSSGENGMRNGNAFVTWSQVPGIKASMTVMAGMLQTSYLNNQSYSARLSKPFNHGKWQLELNYRYLNYSYLNEAADTKQHIYGMNISTLLTKHLSLFFFAEQTDDLRQLDFTRLQTKVMYRW